MTTETTITETPISMDELLLKLRSECKIQVSAATIRRWRRDRQFPLHPNGRSPYVYWSEVLGWFKEGRSPEFRVTEELRRAIGRARKGV